MARCGCSGTSCACKIEGAGGGVSVTGTGTAADPYVVGLDTNSVPIAARVAVDNASTTVKLTKVGGAGTVADPLVLRASIELTAPNGTKYTLAVDNSGALSTVVIS